MINKTNFQQLMLGGNPAATGGAQGNSPNAQGNPLFQSSDWERMLTALLVSQKVGAGGMRGFALGQILAALLKKWKNNYDQRGEMRREWEPLTPEERATRLAEQQAKNPAQADAAREFMRERGFDFGETPQSQIANQPQVQQPQISAPISQAVQQSMPNIDWLNKQPQLLGNAANWEEMLKKLNVMPQFGGGY